MLLEEVDAIACPGRDGLSTARGHESLCDIRRGGVKGSADRAWQGGPAPRRARK